LGPRATLNRCRSRDRGDHPSEHQNLAGEPTKLTYPNGKAVNRKYDKDDRLESVTDWAEHTTKFAYDPDSDLASTTFPTGTSEEDTYAYNDADNMSEIAMKKGSETLASLLYTRNEDEEPKKVVSKGLPGESEPTYTYDEDNRMTKASGVSYGYDAANNAITEYALDDYTYNAADELEKASLLGKTTIDTYTYNEVGQRTKTTPTSGPATSYGYDQAGNLISVTRPKEGSTPAIEDTYTYNGEDLRTSQANPEGTHYLAWDVAEELPLILNDGTYSYIYGPNDKPIEQINSENHPQYLHHDQQDSTRMLTSATGTVEATYTYTPYGTLSSSTGTATTPLGYDGQYTSSDTGLVYLRNRVYDPSTAQFLTVDPAMGVTRAPYNYAADNPVNEQDRTGLEEEGYCVYPVGCVSGPGGGGGRSGGLVVLC